jgi:hypothetical protein
LIYSLQEIVFFGIPITSHKLHLPKSTDAKKPNGNNIDRKTSKQKIRSYYASPQIDTNCSF